MGFDYIADRFAGEVDRDTARLIYNWALQDAHLELKRLATNQDTNAARLIGELADKIKRLQVIEAEAPKANQVAQTYGEEWHTQAARELDRWGLLSADESRHDIAEELRAYYAKMEYMELGRDDWADVVARELEERGYLSELDDAERRHAARIIQEYATNQDKHKEGQP
jgi:hypothetical protein